jgi:O-antigen/teichoic acid export membrane protein
VIVLGVTALVGFASLGHLILSSVFGAAFVPAYGSSLILIGAALFTGLTMIYEGILTGLGRPGQLSRLRILSISILTGFMLGARPTGSLELISLALLGTAAATTVLTGRRASSFLEVKFSSLISTGFADELRTVIWNLRRSIRHARV